MNQLKRTNCSDVARIPVRQSSNSGKGLWETHGLLGNCEKLFYTAVKWGHHLLLTDIQRFSEKSCASVRISPIPCPAWVYGERHAVRCRALPREHSPAPQEKAVKGVIPMLATSSGHLLHLLSTPFITKVRKVDFSHGGRLPRKSIYGGVYTFLQRGHPLPQKPTFTTSHFAGSDFVEFSGGAP